MPENKYVFEGLCYNPFHYLKDVFTCSCGLKVGQDMWTKMFVSRMIDAERRLRDVDRIQEGFRGKIEPAAPMWHCDACDTWNFESSKTCVFCKRERGK